MQLPDVTLWQYTENQHRTHAQMTCTNLKGQKFTLQVSGPHHVSAMEAFPAAAGVADRSAGPDGVHSSGPQAGYGATPIPSPAFSPLNMAGPGKRRLPWAGRCCHCTFFLCILFAANDG